MFILNYIKAPTLGFLLRFSLGFGALLRLPPGRSGLANIHTTWRGRGLGFRV